MGSTCGHGGSQQRWHLQDWLVCVEALVTLTDPDATTPRQRRAWQLVETIAAACNIDSTEYIFEIDDSWGPQTAVDGSASSPQPSDRFDAADWELLQDALTSFADAQQHTKRGQRACQLATAIDGCDQATADH